MAATVRVAQPGPGAASQCGQSLRQCWGPRGPARASGWAPGRPRQGSSGSKFKRKRHSDVGCLLKLKTRTAAGEHAAASAIGSLSQRALAGQAIAGDDPGTRRPGLRRTAVGLRRSHGRGPSPCAPVPSHGVAASVGLWPLPPEQIRCTVQCQSRWQPAPGVDSGRSPRDVTPEGCVREPQCDPSSIKVGRARPDQAVANRGQTGPCSRAACSSNLKRGALAPHWR